MTIASIILAAGKGTRINSKKINKAALIFCGKPMIVYGVELMQNFTTDIMVVIGAFTQSIKDVLKGYKVIYAYQ